MLSTTCQLLGNYLSSSCCRICNNGPTKLCCRGCWNGAGDSDHTCLEGRCYVLFWCSPWAFLIEPTLRRQGHTTSQRRSCHPLRSAMALGSNMLPFTLLLHVANGLVDKAWRQSLGNAAQLCQEFGPRLPPALLKMFLLLVCSAKQRRHQSTR